MTRVNFWPSGSLLASLYTLCGIYRHDPLMCDRPGVYRVVFCADQQWKLPHFNAVCDDFGNLVVVP